MPPLDHFGRAITGGRTFFGHAATDFAATIHVGTSQQQIPDLKKFNRPWKWNPVESP